MEQLSKPALMLAILIAKKGSQKNECGKVSDLDQTFETLIIQGTTEKTEQEAFE